ncbi:radical SAM protein [Thalassospira xiamenensis]|uniref:Radical SAM additional 4Fe4S-binding SPASM domain-containing protein n=1 Tax=Thalassospira xiamenensis TaxID=220697 RepID=A0A285TUI4_9PROT|nr:radical SAM protein [Thalassospira xiamenensis]SOC27085.1 radical SAM additional 4Fe4S-binding SPASM domain-containing protein [Thalassospira xiamenensis]
MSGTVPFTPKFDHLIYMRVFEGCDLRCQHCFIPANPRRLKDADVEHAADKVRTFAKPGDRILVQWHGGEPTLLGAAWLRKAIETLETTGPEFEWIHGIQTNLLGYNGEWAQLYHDKFNGEVGVSWDAKIRLTRRDDPASFADFENRFWPKMEQLLADGLHPYLVVTATKVLFQTFKNPVDFFSMLESRGITRGHLERVTETGEARKAWDTVGLSNAEYSRYMSRYARAYVLWNMQAAEQGRPHLSLSPFDGLLKSTDELRRGEAKGYGCWSGNCDTRFHTIDADGYKRGCTALTSEDGNSRATAKLALDKDNLVEERKLRRIVDCHACEFRKICSSGCMAISMDDGSGECAGGYSLFKAATAIVSNENCGWKLG